MKRKELKAKIMMQEPVELINIICAVTMIKNIYLNMDIVDYRILKYLLVNHAKITSNIDNLFYSKPKLKPNFVSNIPHYKNVVFFCSAIYNA